MVPEAATMSDSITPQRPGSNDQRVKFLVNSELLSDVSFTVGKAETVIYAHRFPLATASDVFYQMFTEKPLSGPVAREPIAVPDVEPETFIEMLKFLYYDNPTISEDNLVELYYAANKYNLVRLKKLCHQFISIEEASVMKVLTRNIPKGFAELNDACLTSISRNPLVVFRSSDFLELPLELVEQISRQNKLRCNDDQLLDALRKWCRYQKDNQTELFDQLSGIVRKRQKQSRDFQCRKWLFFGPICYTIDSCKGTFLVTAIRDFDLFGVGMYIGCQENEQPMSISVVIMSGEKMIRRCQANVPPREDIYVYDCMLERISLRAGAKVTIMCDGPRRSDGVLKKFTFWNRGFSWTGDSSIMKVEDERNFEHTAIAYLLYQIKPFVDQNTK
ncbi:BTB/POZ domain-containing protein 6-like [Wyeomyia smithii]|uniref:BTB/POZ domain-containing protein 6-like n=1 Tax=Wyeomyia smithii TaxID=174621 RepID=UPI002467FF31|nr:BTB/POZ domain-containing protein 6-like [Wyeomyia smithii]